MMNLEVEKKIIKSINLLLTPDEYCSEFGLDDINRRVNFSKSAHLIKAIEIFRKAKEFELSLECSKYLVQFHAESPISFQRLIQDYLACDFISDALNTAIRAIKKFEDDPGLLMLTSNAYRANGQIEHALKYSLHLRNKHPDLPAGYYCTAQNMATLGRLRDAKNTIQSLIDSIDSPLSRELTRDFYRDIGLRNRAKKISFQIANEFPLLDNHRQCAVDLLVLGQIERFYRYSRKKNLINNDIDKKYFSSIISTDFAMNLSKPISRSWRSLSSQHKIYNHYNDQCFNKYPDEIAKDDQVSPWLCIIHVGKCAGETVIKTLRRSLPSLRMRIIEYHVFDSNILIAQLLKLSQSMSNIEIIFCTRDPLERWISAFNWDYYTYKLNRHYYCPSSIVRLFDIYSSSKELAQGMHNGDKEAFMLANARHFIFGHMTMGQSWYLPKKLINTINQSQAYIIRTENIVKDLQLCLHRLVNKYPNLIAHQNAYVPKFKNSLNFRADFKFALSCDLTQKERLAILQHISEDEIVNQMMTTEFLTNSE